MSQPALSISAMRSRARSFTEEALKTLAHVMMHPRATHMARITAANSLLDRGWGKATQIIAGDSDAPVIVNHIVRKIVGEEIQAKVIEHVSNPLEALPNPVSSANDALASDTLEQSVPVRGRTKADLEREALEALTPPPPGPPK